jgi:protein-S-isoprenylcysteine O-methyltransferase Ste14
MQHFGIASCLLLIAGFCCFAAFSWGVKSHFRQTGKVPLGTYLISVLTVAGFLWFAWRIATGMPSMLWQAAFILFLLSLALFAWTIRASRATPPTLAFDTDEPSFLLKHGPYRHVRHPFDLSYLLFWIGTAIASPGLLPWLAPVVMLLVYWNAATREERKFASSGLSTAYQRYRAEAGMFLPRLGSSPIPD